jgi:hypothetical protein
MQRYIAFHLSNMIILIIPSLTLYIIYFSLNLNEIYDQIITGIFIAINLGLILFNFYKVKRIEKLCC